MDYMDTDSSSPQLRTREPLDPIAQRLARFGVPEEVLDQSYAGLVAFVQDNKSSIPGLVTTILSPEEDDALVATAGPRIPLAESSMKDQFHEAMIWLQWLMFEGDPGVTLTNLYKINVGQRGVCGAVWGHNDIAYRCRTCEQDPTCAICVPCFQNGNHKEHDYSIIYTGGGCCDCGDATAWKREGFCSKHKGAEEIQPLPEEIANSVGPVLDPLLVCWESKLSVTETISQENTKSSDQIKDCKEIADELTFAVVGMLLEFCKYSESLLSFVSRRVFSSVGLLQILVRAEMFLGNSVVKKLHELLLKWLGEPAFKYEFAKVFLCYYPTVVNKAIKDCSDNVLKNYPLLSTFSVQIFTVPTLTPRLVMERNLLAMLLGCLGDIFIYCAIKDGHLKVNKWANLFGTTFRVVEDVRFVMSHVVVPKYVIHGQREIAKTWMKLLAFVQGMNPQKRETGLHVEEENESTHLPFALCHSIANIHSLLVAGAFSVASGGETNDEILFNTYKQDIDDRDIPRHAKVGRLSQESSACSMVGRTSALACAPKVAEVESNTVFHQLIPPSVTWLTCECLRAIENWLGEDNSSEALLNIQFPNTSSIASSNFSALKKTLSEVRKGKYIFGGLNSSSKDRVRQHSSLLYSGFRMSVGLENGESTRQDGISKMTDEFDLVNAHSSANSDDSAFEGDCATELEALHILSLSDWPHIIFDVSSQDISVHIPLHRLLSMLLQKTLTRCYGESAMPHDFFGCILGGCHPYGFSAFVMEHPLRIRVFCAEVHAGMWRKNGDSAILSNELYHSVHWTEPGLELDLFLLQCCAALAPADLYAERILQRFGLLNYISLNLEQSSEYEPVLVQEMLNLIIQIVKERRFCGLTTAEGLKRELICKLAIGDATRSQLVKSLPCDLSKFDQLQEILDTIALYSNPSGINQGMYSLRWAYWKELDLYHPRWNSRDLQVAEERYMRFCNVSALNAQLPKWTTIYPPLKGVARIATCKVVLQIVRAVLFYSVFTDKVTESRAPDSVLLTALHLLSLALDICFHQRKSNDQSCYVGDSIPILAFAGEAIDQGFHYGAGEQSLLSLLVSLVGMHKKESLGNFMEAGNCNLSSLIESLLRKFAEIDSGCLAKLQQLAPEVVYHVSQPVPNSDTNISRSVSDGENRKAKARERQAAALEKMRAEQFKFLASINSNVDDDSKSGQEVCSSDVRHDSQQSAQDVCSLCHDPNSNDHVSFLILIQKSRLSSFVDSGPPPWEQVGQSEKECNSITTNKSTDQSGMSNSSTGSGVNSSSQLEQLVQDAVNELSYNCQPGEAVSFVEFIKARFPSMRNIQLLFTYNDRREGTVYSFETLEQDMYNSIRKEMHDIFLYSNFTKGDKKFSFSEGNSQGNRDSESVLLGKYIASLSREITENPSASENAHIEVFGSTRQPIEYDRFGPACCDGMYLSSCGHAVHQRCLDRYLSSLRERFVRRIVFEGGHIVDPDKGEFLCPVCRRLSNSVLPALPGDFQFGKQTVISSVSSPRALHALETSNEGTCFLRLQQALCLLCSTVDVVWKDENLKAFPLWRSGKTANLEPISELLTKMYFPGKQDKLLGSARVSNSMLMWDTLKYSLISTEIASRCGRANVTPNYGLDALYMEFKSSSEFILSLLVKIVQSTRSINFLDVLQRFRGIHLFAESICSGISLDYPGGTSGQGGNMLCILKHVEMEVTYPDIQFWNQASDPVLAHDPFSSLIWVLFCLPYPFLMCEDSILSLVHLFYVVSIAQAVISYCAKYQGKINELGFHDCLITDISKVMGESQSCQQCFVSNYIDPSCDTKDTIRRLSFPYLRRCALLWKLLDSSTPVPFCSVDHVMDGPFGAIDDMMDSTDELREVHKLEIMFKIPSVDVVLKDELVRSLVLKWFHHFCKDFEVRNFRCCIYSTPAVPFKLMQLPHVYQDLLQRYIKKSCPDCNSVLKEPALCLICGRLCSANRKSCCRQNGCQTHAMVCGAGIGVFLLTRRTTILLQRSAREAPWPSPYLDAFGEEDIDMNRGKPLYLNEERYAALTYMVASHGLDRSSKVLGQTTIGTFFMV